ncbi:hypothetical protein D3C77_459010 [compost metagenome]
MNPRTFEKSSILIAGKQRIAFLIHDGNFHRRLFESQHILAQLSHSWAKRRRVCSGSFRVRFEAAGLPFLQLSAPQSAEINIRLIILINKNGRIDAVASRHIIRLRREWTGWRRARSYAESEDAVMIPGREEQIVCIVLIGGIGSP